MDIIFTPDDYRKWSVNAIDKIVRVISTCENDMHLESAQKMIDLFLVVSAFQHEMKDHELQYIMHMLWLKMKFQEHIIYLNNGPKERKDWFHGWEF